MSKTTERNYELLYVHPRNSAECGFDSKNCFTLPFFRMGCPGEEEGLIGTVTSDPVTELNMVFFDWVANMIKFHGFYDWDWESFKKNILKPNKHHIMKACKIKNNKLWDRFYTDGCVFLNHWFDDDYIYDGEDEDHNPRKIKNTNRNSVFTDMDVEY